MGLASFGLLRTGTCFRARQTCTDAVLCRLMCETYKCRYAFFDIDNVIERAHPGETVADIFSKYGEDYFRQCEEQVRTVWWGWGNYSPSLPRRFWWMVARPPDSFLLHTVQCHIKQTRVLLLLQKRPC